MRLEEIPPEEAAKRCMVDASIQVANMMGYSDAAGALRGSLILADGPLSMDELVEVTGYSKSTVSTNMAQLERMSIVRRVRKPGDKKHYYATITSIDEGTKAHNENFRQIMQILLAGVNKALELLEKAESSEEIDRLRLGFATFREDCTKAQRLADLLDRFSISELIEILKREVEIREAGEK
ncbi:MAG TPA: MarR family transcriptional regulator [Methanotrichaceae archaeon]|nr:MarR family transcriptional regulator [Methanotrichaceae archaeon]